MKIARQAWPYAAGLALLAGAAALLLHPYAGLLPLPLLAFTLWFFRDPERVRPTGDPALPSPADGRVLHAGSGKISIFMGLTDVHVCRAPMDGRIESVEHRPGRFLAAFRDEAAEHNEQTSIVIVDGERRLCFRLVAGLVARRIVVWVRPGQQVRAGDRVGLIQFGSRVDVDLPEGFHTELARNQRVKAGLTPIARPDGKGDGS